VKASFFPTGALFALVLGAPTGCHSPSEQSARDAGEQHQAVPNTPMNVTPIPAASVAAYMNPAHLPPYTGPTGSVQGTIRVAGPPSPVTRGVDFSACPDGAKMYGTLFREGLPGPDGTRPLADALVAITGYSGFYLPERDEAQVLEIRDCAFASRTVAMTFGQRLEVANKAPELWAPMLTQAPMPVLMMATSNGDPVRLYPPHPGYFTLVDKGKHQWATVDVYALLHPLHAVSDPAGHYRIDGVPVGKLKVNARLAAIQREASAEVNVVAGEIQTVDLVIQYAPAPEIVRDGGPKPHVIP
jgi:hypothetical protein